MNTQHNQIAEIKRRKQCDTVFVATNNTNNNANFSNVQQKENAQHSQYAQYIQNKTRQTYTSSPKVYQNLNQNGIKTEKAGVIEYIILAIVLIGGAFAGLGLLGGALSEKFNQVSTTGLGNPEDRFAYKNEQWWE